MPAFRVSSREIMEVHHQAIGITSGFVFRQTRTIPMRDVRSVALSGHPARSLELHLADGTIARLRFSSAREAERARSAIAEALEG
jgi:membrane protein YdbS with pleckstrin-like domain